MAGVTGKRLRLTTSRTPSYWRGGVAIGSLASPAYLDRDSVPVGQLLEIVGDPNIVLAFEDEDGEVHVLSDEERAEIAEALQAAIEEAALAASSSEPPPPSQPDTAEPQGEGTFPARTIPAAEASQVSGPEVTADASTGSAADAGTTEPGSPQGDTAPAKLAPTTSGASKPKKVKAQA